MTIYTTGSLPRVSLQGVTPDAEAFMGYVARVSNPQNQDNPKVAGLLKYCIKHGHWSVFEHAQMTLEITTTLDVATQILRHRSFTFQQLSSFARWAGSCALTSSVWYSQAVVFALESAAIRSPDGLGHYAPGTSFCGKMPSRASSRVHVAGQSSENVPTLITLN